MKQACEATGLSYDTLKFYCNEGLVPGLRRDENNYRVFTEKNLEWVRNLSCLKNCGMSVSEMKRYVALCRQGKETIAERRDILSTKLQNLRQEIERIEKNIDFIMYKQQFYQDVLDGKCEYYSNLEDDETERLDRSSGDLDDEIREPGQLGDNPDENEVREPGRSSDNPDSSVPLRQ